MRLPAFLVTLLIVLTACGDAHQPGREPDSTAPESGQETFPAADERVPAGYREELCPDLRVRSTGLAVRIVVPDDYRLEVSKYRNDCRFAAAIGRGFSVALDSRQAVRRYQETWVDPHVGYEGDTDTGDIAYAPDVAVYGDRRGELLTWGSNNDGLAARTPGCRRLHGVGAAQSWTAFAIVTHMVR